MSKAPSQRDTFRTVKPYLKKICAALGIISFLAAWAYGLFAPDTHYSTALVFGLAVVPAFFDLLYTSLFDPGTLLQEEGPLQKRLGLFFLGHCWDPHDDALKLCVVR